MTNNYSKTNEVNSDEDNIKYLNFEEGCQLVKEEVERALSTSPSIIRKYTKHLTLSNGKNIRANSLLLCADQEGKGIHPDGVKLAASIEILHLATLVHDDVIDDSDLRRGIITLQKKYGRKTAVICGDYLLCTALRLSASVEQREKFLKFKMPDYMGKVCLGELNQHLNNGNLDLSVFQYLKIISGKTAALFEASFYAGAILNETESDNSKRYKLLGQYIGMIFQLTDDLIDFEKSVEVAKKPVQSDFEQGVITAPLIHALREKNSFKEKARNHGITREELNKEVESTGGISFTKGIVKRYYEKAMNIIDELSVTNVKRERLISILDKAAGVI